MKIQKIITKNYLKLVLLIILFMLIVSILNAKNDSAIFDETAHIGAAYTYVTQHEIRLNPEHPPLIKDLAGLPLLFLNLKLNVEQPFWTGELPRKWDEGQWVSGRSLLYQSNNNPDQIIFWSRFPIIIISIILGIFIFKWVKEMEGKMAGLFALMIYAFDPNILGHNHFVTTDLGIAAFVCFAFYYFLKFIKNPSWKNVFVGGFFLGLLQLAKFSSVIAFPVFFMILVIYPIARAEKNNPKENIFISKLKILGEYFGKGIAAFIISLLVVWGLYFLNTYKMERETVSQSINFILSPQSENPKTVTTNKILHKLNEKSITRPLAVYGEGLGYVFQRVAGGNGAYFMGEVSSKAFKAYFPVVFLLKEPIPTMIFMLFALSFGLYKIFRIFRNDLKNPKKIAYNIFYFVRYRIVEITLFSYILLYSYVSITGNLNIGFRHLFPILPFAYILTAKNIFEFFRQEKDKISVNITRSFFVLLSVFLVLNTIITYPSYMSYFNPMGGGPKNGYQYVTDSNADWGQDLKRLRNWIEKYNECLMVPAHNPENGNPFVCYSNFINKPYEYIPAIDKIRVDYFGGGDVGYYLKAKYLPWWDSKRPIEPGWYAISTNFLQGSLHDKTKKDNASYRWIKNKQPLYQVGTSIFIYYVTEKEAVDFNNKGI